MFSIRTGEVYGHPRGDIVRDAGFCVSFLVSGEVLCADIVVGFCLRGSENIRGGYYVAALILKYDRTEFHGETFELAAADVVDGGICRIHAPNILFASKLSIFIYSVPVEVRFSSCKTFLATDVLQSMAITASVFLNVLTSLRMIYSQISKLLAPVMTSFP